MAKSKARALLLLLSLCCWAVISNAEHHKFSTTKKSPPHPPSKVPSLPPSPPKVPPSPPNVPPPSPPKVPPSPPNVPPLSPSVPASVPKPQEFLAAKLTRVRYPGSYVPYFVTEMLVGDPPSEPIDFIVDTVGRATAIPQLQCPKASPLPCDHPICQGDILGCDQSRRQCFVKSLGGETMDLVATSVSMQRPGRNATVTARGIAVTCADTPYVSLSPANTSLVSQLKVGKFAYCLGKPRGALFLGRNEDYELRDGRSLAKALRYVPLVESPLAWQRNLGYRLPLKNMAIAFGSKRPTPLAIAPDAFRLGVLISTKARYTSLVDPAYQIVRRHFRRAAAEAGSNLTQVPSPFPELNLCYQFGAVNTSVAGAPKILLLFENNVTITVEPRNYIVRWRTTDVVCLGIVSAGPLGGVSEIGTLQQEETLVEIDLDKRRVGFTEQLIKLRTSCEELDLFGWWPKDAPGVPPVGTQPDVPVPGAPAPTGSSPQPVPTPTWSPQPSQVATPASSPQAAQIAPPTSAPQVPTPTLAPEPARTATPPQAAQVAPPTSAPRVPSPTLAPEPPQVATPPQAAQIAPPTSAPRVPTPTLAPQIGTPVSSPQAAQVAPPTSSPQPATPGPGQVASPTLAPVPSQFMRPSSSPQPATAPSPVQLPTPSSSPQSPQSPQFPSPASSPQSAQVATPSSSPQPAQVVTPALSPQPATPALSPQPAQATTPAASSQPPAASGQPAKPALPPQVAPPTSAPEAAPGQVATPTAAPILTPSPKPSASVPVPPPTTDSAPTPSGRKPNPAPAPRAFRQQPQQPPAGICVPVPPSPVQQRPPSSHAAAPRPEGTSASPSAVEDEVATGLLGTLSSWWNQRHETAAVGEIIVGSPLPAGTPLPITIGAPLPDDTPVTPVPIISQAPPLPDVPAAVPVPSASSDSPAPSPGDKGVGNVVVTPAPSGGNVIVIAPGPVGEVVVVGSPPSPQPATTMLNDYQAP